MLRSLALDWAEQKREDGRASSSGSRQLPKGFRPSANPWVIWKFYDQLTRKAKANRRN